MSVWKTALRAAGTEKAAKCLGHGNGQNLCLCRGVGIPDVADVVTEGALKIAWALTPLMPKEDVAANKRGTEQFSEHWIVASALD